jgi:4-amino-4-deoxy-L-arabinose transferase-like glycosyltransferase
MVDRETRSGRPVFLTSTMTETAGTRYWQTLAILLAGVILAAGALWASRQATGTDWDEAGYINRAIRDRYTFQAEGLYGLVRTIGCHEAQRPPAYRMMVVPITIPFGVSTAGVRYISIFVFAATLAIVYLLGRRLAGPACGAFTVLLLVTGPTMLLHAVTFGTEFPLYLSVAGSLYFLTRRLHTPQRSLFDIVGLGFFLGLGLLSKTSFIIVAAPMMATAFVLDWRGNMPGLSPAFLLKAALVGGLLALPWWLRSWREALAYAEYSSTFTRHSLGGFGLPMLIQWFGVFARSATGIALLLLIAAVLARALVSRQALHRLEPHQRAALWICLAGGIPLILVQLLGRNHNMRLITPAFFPLAVALGLIAAATSWTRARLLTGAATTVFALQAATIAVPSFAALPVHDRETLGIPPSQVLAARELWNWEALRQACQDRHLANPVLQYLGNGSSYCIPHISHPWVRRNEPATVAFLWRYEEGPIDWKRIRAKLAKANVVLTVLNYQGLVADKQPLDNAHNSELAALLKNDPRFEGPVEIDVGARPPAQIVAFFRAHQESPFR